MWVPEQGFGLRIYTESGELVTFGYMNGPLVQFDFSADNLFRGFFESQNDGTKQLGVIDDKCSEQDWAKIKEQREMARNQVIIDTD